MVIEGVEELKTLRKLNMAVFVFVLLFTCTFLSRFLCSTEYSVGKDYELTISATKMTVGQPIVLRKGDTLNLTCRLTSPSNRPSRPRFKLTLHTPYYPQNSMNRVLRNESYNSLNIAVQNVQESDSGDYKCLALIDDDDQTQLQQRVRVVVKDRKSCSPQFFTCPSTGACIMQRYICDGFRDCKGGEDEAEDKCGLNPCENKLRCEDRRCIPIEWCCDAFHDSNCTGRVIPPCCLQSSKAFMDHDPGYMNEQQPQLHNDMGFLQTTIYTVVGCAMAFMFIVTILVIAICRVHMKRSSLLTRCSGGRGGIMMAPHANNRAPYHHHHHGLQHVPLYDLDVLLNRSPYPPASSVPPHSGLLVTYNINNGVQFVGRPVDPPPYCEIVASPPREGPPPPYASHENLPRTTPEASSTAQDDADGDENPSEGDSLLGPGRGTEHMQNLRLRGSAMQREYLEADTAAPPSRQPEEDVERNCQVGCTVSVPHDHNPTSNLDTLCGLGNDDRVGELLVESGVSVSGCENVVVAPKVPDTSYDITLSNTRVSGKTPSDASHVHHLDSSAATRKISCSTQEDGNFNVVCESQENPLQCLHDTFINVHTNSNGMNPDALDASTASVRMKTSESSASRVTLDTRTHADAVEE